MRQAFDFLGIASFFAVLFTPIIACNILKKYANSTAFKLVMGTVIASGLALLLVTTGSIILFRDVVFR